MNILIADDNANNRMILRLLLEDLEEENQEIKFHLKEASDGLDAINKCDKENFDIILIDIMMPNMDGIEATKIIKEKYPNIMIIAVSAVDDKARQKEILNAGAEDYISKPVNSDIFISRIKNYITLIKNRQHNIKNDKNINVFTNEVYSRHTRFILKNEDTISEFWEFFLLNARKKYDNLSDVVRTIFAIAEIQMKLSIVSNVYIEESEVSQYFTLTDVDKLPPKVLDLVLKKNKPPVEYKIFNDKLSFELIKLSGENNEEEIEKVNEIIDINKILDANIVENNYILDDEIKSKDLVVYSYIDDDDLLDLKEYSLRMSSLMLVVGGGDIEDEEVIEIYSYLEKIGSVLATYSEITPISKALSLLAYEIANHVEEFSLNAEALGPMCKAFSNDILSWIRMSFETGAPSAEFMNDTISVNCDTIVSMLKINESIDDSSLDDLDDIFDF